MRIELFVFLFFFLIKQWAAVWGQTTLIVEKLPENTPPGAGIYISGDFENWSGGNNSYQLKPHGESYLIDLPAVDQEIAFKFTRGSWESVEVDSAGASISNRSLKLGKNNDTIRLGIVAWSDLTKAISTASDQVHLLSENFDMGTLERNRRIWIYLPKGYEDSNKEYPVLYMHDGQNLFDKSTSFTGEWEVDETLDYLSESKVLELIVVGIENGGQERINEYTPYKLNSYASKAEGARYVKFISEVLKPYVDDNYRTLTNREHTGIMGSSLGGLISFYASMEFEDTFGMAGIFSPSFELIDPVIPKEEIIKPLSETRLYLMCGDQESEQMVPAMQTMIKEMIDLGFESDNIFSVVVKGGMHNEELWQKEFENAVRWLFKN